ncbi:MAG: phosphate butyryltransferase [Candidatus Adiutrix sp.]|jgi:phosphate butyryltransferase|nr:phosphate butyryltransferase [Candidatus Adiutrix sp.]
MYKTFEELIAAAQKRGPKKVAVAVAQDPEILAAMKHARDLGLAVPVLVGEASAVHPLAEKAGFGPEVEIVDEADQDQAALKAASLVSEGRAQVLMKGLINSGNFLKAVLNKERGLRRNKVLSHLAVFEAPGVDRLMFHSDGGMNVLPDLETKKEILINALQAMASMGLSQPAVAVLSHNEQVNEKMPSTTDAAALVAMAGRGELPPCVIEGPLALDVAASAEAARHKKIRSRIAGQVDLFIFPNIEAGNIAGKTLNYYARAKMAGLILGAAAPVIMASRSDDAAAKLNSIALGCLSAG